MKIPKSTALRIQAAGAVQSISLVVSIWVLFRDPRSLPYVFPYVACTTLFAVSTAGILLRATECKRTIITYTFIGCVLSLIYGFLFWPIKAPSGPPRGQFEWFMVSSLSGLFCFTLARPFFRLTFPSNNPAA